MRRIGLPSVGVAILADTVGFIRHLPHKLVESFRATLEEAAEADLLLHVIDCAADERMDNIEEVNKVLAEIDAGDIPTLEVYNKIDLMPDQLPRIELGADGRPARVWVSATKQLGLDKLVEAISLSLGDRKLEGDMVLAPSQGAIRARLYRHDAVLEERYDEQGNTVLRLRISAEDLKRLAAGDYPLENLEWWSDPALES
jgi:GTP-binding protein HflX